MTPIVENVLETYRSASFAAFSEGMTWYDDAHSFALSLDPQNPSRAAGIIAALSPMNAWTNNKRKAAAVYALAGDITVVKGQPNGIGLGNNVAKALAIYNGAEPLDVLNGDKVRAFYATILDPTGDVDPVIDRHAFDIAVGYRTNDAARQALGRKGVYRQFANVYRAAADYIGIGSAQLQAVTWVSWRETNGIVV